MTTFIYPPIPLDKTGLATEAEQQAQTALLTTIENNTDSIEQNQLDQTALLTQIESSTQSLPTIEADTADILVEETSQTALLTDLEARLAGSLVPVAHDYLSITYVGATTDINTVTYKTGGSGGTTVATLTMGYDGSNRLTSVIKS